MKKLITAILIIALTTCLSGCSALIPLIGNISDDIQNDSASFDESIGIAEYIENADAGAYDEVDLSENDNRYEINEFMSYFSKYVISDYNEYTDRNLERVIDFIYYHLKLEYNYEFETEVLEDGHYWTYTLDEANEICEQFFGFTLTEEEVEEEFSKDREEDVHDYYEDGKFWHVAADGAMYNNFTIVNNMYSLGDDYYLVKFDVYAIGFETYLYEDEDASRFFSKTTDYFDDEEDINVESSGYAIVKKAEDGYKMKVNYPDYGE